MEIIKLNLIPSGVNPVCHCSQYDSGRVIRIELFDGLTPYTLASGDTVTLNVRKPDNTIVTASVTATQGNNYVDIITTEQICACVGTNLCDITLKNGSVVIGTLNFYMQIERDVLADGDPSQSVIRDLDALAEAAVNAQISDFVSDINNKSLSMIPTNKASDCAFVDNLYRYYETGEIRPNTNYCYSHEIIVVPNTFYKLSGVSNYSHITFYDKDHNYVSGVLSTVPFTILSIPSNAIYMIASILKTEKTSLTLEWFDYRLTANTKPIKLSSDLSDFNNADWNKWYVINITLEADLYNISNMPAYENGLLITYGSNSDNYAGKQIYITNSGDLYIRYYVPATSSFTDWQSSKTVKKDGVLYDKKIDSNAVGDFAGDYTVVTGGFAVRGNARLKKFFSIENRTALYLVLLSSDTVAGFGTREYTNFDVNTEVIVNIPNKTVQLNGFSAEPCSFLTGGHFYAFELSKKYEVLAIKLTDMNTGDVFVKEYTKNGTGGAGEGAVGTDNGVPMQYDTYCCRTVSGTNLILNKMVVKCETADVVLYGDSITEPEAYYPTDDFNKSWTQLLIANSSKKCVTSGRSGTTITQLIERIQNELPYINAKYCVVTIGTNGGNTEANLTTLIRIIKKNGAIPILNHIPCFDNNGDTTGFITRNALIDTVRANENIKGCNFDLATSLNYDGQAVNPDMMWLETYSGGAVYRHHPNVKGSAAMLAQLKNDVPEIF